jgi:hypothetical protein
MDVMLNYAVSNGDELNICDTEPTTYTEAHTTYMLAQVAITGADYTLADGDTSGRKVTVAGQTGVTVTNAGTSAFAAIVDTAGSDLLLYSPCTAVALLAGNTINTTSFDWEVTDAA